LRGLLRSLKITLLLILRSILHIPELLPYLPRRPGNGHNKIEYKAVQYIEYDRKKEYFR
jgi:hypothetical protein